MASQPTFFINTKYAIFSVLVMFGLAAGLAARAQDTSVTAPEQEFMRGKVIDITDEQRQISDGFDFEAQQTALIELRTGSQKGQVVTVDYIFSSLNFDELKLSKGDRVVMAMVTSEGFAPQFYVMDSYRLPWVLVLTVIFAGLACLLGRRKGAGALLGLGLSIAVIMLVTVPWIIRGGNPLTASLVGALIIAVASMLLAHGTSRRTLLALGATLGTLIMAVVLALLSVYSVGLSGSGTEEAIFLQIGYLSGLNLRGLLLGAIIIGTLGVLDDVTTAQVAAIEEIHKADKRLSGWELYRRGLSVGREHIASLVNTLILAYVGAAFPLFLLFAMPDHPPIWVIVNGENIVEEIVRALVGGAALMLAVPVSTAIAAFAFGRKTRRV